MLSILIVPSNASTKLSLKDSTFEFEKRRNVPVRYDRELMKTTLKAIQRVGEIRQRREHAFWKNRCVTCSVYLPAFSNLCSRMAAARAKKLAHRKKKLLKATPVKLLQPMSALSVDESSEKIREKIKVPAKSSLVAGEGRSMGMEID